MSKESQATNFGKRYQPTDSKWLGRKNRKKRDKKAAAPGGEK